MEKTSPILSLIEENTIANYLKILEILVIDEAIDILKIQVLSMAVEG